MAKKQLTEQKLKKLIKKLKDAKKKKRKQKRDALISQRVTQKVIIGGRAKPESNTGRSFPQVQFLPQPQIQNGDTQLLREIFLRNNLSPLIRPPISRVPYKPSYDLGDQYGLNYNDNPYNSGSIGSQPQDNQDNQSDNSALSYDDAFRQQDDNLTNISLRSDDTSDMEIYSKKGFDLTSLLQTPPEKQGNLDMPIPNPKPNALAQTKTPIAVQKYMEKESDFFSRDTKILPEDDEFERPNENPTLKDKPTPRKLKNQYKDEDFSVADSNQDIHINTTEKPKKQETRGRKKGGKNKPKETTVVPK